MTKTAQNDAWVERFGTLADVTERESAKGPYITFKLEAKGFTAYGACFDTEVIAKMKEAVGKRVWMKGPLEARKIVKDGAEVEQKSFKAIYFNVSDKQEDAEAAAEGVEAEAA
jgi:hypothetical protein